MCTQHAPRILLYLGSRNRPGLSRAPHGDTKTRYGHPRGGEGGTPALTPEPYSPPAHAHGSGTSRTTRGKTTSPTSVSSADTRCHLQQHC